MVTIRNLISTASCVAALCIPLAAHAQRPQRVQTLCNDGTVYTNADHRACDRHGGIRSTTTINGRVDDRIGGKVLPGQPNGNVIVPGGVMNNGARDRVYQGMGRGGRDIALLRRENGIDQTRNHAAAQCNDGYYYHGPRTRRACMYDDGVARWF